MEAAKRTINDIFNGNRVLEIPFFQRAYVWGMPQWQRMLEDMEMVSQSQKPYFLGSLILKQQPTGSGRQVGDVRTVIDGQQRLTTVSIFLKALCLINDKNTAFEKIFVLETNDLALSHNHLDLKAFNQVLRLTQKEKITGEGAIVEAFNYFIDCIDPKKIDRSAILNNIIFVGIDLAENEDEQQIFDTINSLGVRLTTAELLKNYFFDRTKLVDYTTYWKDVFEKDPDCNAYWDREITTGRLTRTFIDLFFYSFLQIKVQDAALAVKSGDKDEFSRVETLFDSYKRLIKEYKLDKKNLLGEIKEYALLFKKNFDYDLIDEELTDEYGIERINAIIFGLDTSTLIPYVLYVLKNSPDEVQRNELFRVLESYIMRRMVANATSKNYNQLFTDRLISKNITTSSQFIQFVGKDSNSDKVNYLPSDQELEEGFQDSKLINKQAAGVLYFIESKVRDRKRQATQLLGLNQYSLEHLMPKKWENNWPALTDPNKLNDRNRKLLTLGNLAIITQGLNSSIRDAEWEKKKHGREKHGGLVHFSAGLETLSAYLNLPDWNEQEIEKRASELCANAIKIWAL